VSSYQALLKALDVTQADVATFRDTNVGLHRVEVSRLSQYLLAPLASFHKHRSLNTFAVTDAVQSLEGLGGPLPSESESQFQDPPLKSRWKVHFVDTSFLPKNLANEQRSEFPKEEFEELCARVISEDAANPSTHGWAGRLAHELTFGSYESKTSRHALTGEWLIFAKKCDKNYYLCVAKHPSTREGDKAIHSDISRLCAGEFPFLSVPESA
jgi:hypothetical protein